MQTSALKSPHALHFSRTQLIRPEHAPSQLQYGGRISWKPHAASEDQLPSDVKDVVSSSHTTVLDLRAPLGGQSGGRAMCCSLWAIGTDLTARLSDLVSSGRTEREHSTRFYQQP